MVTNTSGFPGVFQKVGRLIEAGRYPEARVLAENITRKHPDDAGAWYILAGIYASLGQQNAVIDCCKRVTRLCPDHAGAHYNLAIGLQHTGHLSEAADSYRQCLKIEPNNITAMINLGKLLGNEGKHNEALQQYEKATSANPECSEAYYCMGVQLQSVGRLSEAATAYKKAIHIRPNYFEAINNLGHLLTEQGELNRALGTFQSLLNINPESPEALNNIGVVYDSMGKSQEAEASYRKAISINPALADTRCHLGYLLADEGRTREALDCFDTNLNLLPGHESSIAGKAFALEKLGQLDEAHSTLESVSIDTTINSDIVLAYCNIMLRKNATADAIRQAERLLEINSTPTKGIVDLHYALGSLHEKDGNYPIAFHHFEKANRISPCTYLHNKHVHYINSIIRRTGKEALAQIPKASNARREVIFIVGMPRSGTSLIEQILASHPDVFGAGELRYMGDIATSFAPPLAETARYPENIVSLSQSEVNELAKRYIIPVEGLVDNSRLITDKMPHNFLYLALISILVPNAKFIHVTRSPLDNCLSLFFCGFNPIHSYTTDMYLLGRYYREYQRLMAHWRHTLNAPILEIAYEDIVNHLERSTRRLLDFCQLDWSDSCLDFHKNSRFVKTPSYDQVRQPIYSSSINRWKKYKEFITPLQAALGLEETRHLPSPPPSPERRGG